MSVIITASSTQCCDNRCLATEHISLVGSCFLVLISKTILLVNGGCNFLGSVLPQQKFEVTDGPVLQLSFICQAKENTSSRREGRLTQKTRREGRQETQFWLFLLCFFSPPPEPALCKLGQPGEVFASTEVLTLVLRPFFLLFSWAFPFFVLQPPPFWTPFSYSNYLKLLKGRGCFFHIFSRLSLPAQCPV